MNVSKFLRAIDMSFVVSVMILLMFLCVVIGGFRVSTTEGLLRLTFIILITVLATLTGLYFHLADRRNAKKVAVQEARFFVNPITGDKVQLHVPGQVRVLMEDETYKSFQPSN